MGFFFRKMSYPLIGIGSIPAGTLEESFEPWLGLGIGSSRGWGLEALSCKSTTGWTTVLPVAQSDSPIRLQNRLFCGRPQINTSNTPVHLILNISRQVSYHAYST